MGERANRYPLLHRFFPFLPWLREYRVSLFRNDLAAGLTVAVVLIPQSIAYAMLAGMPPVYGLYAAAVTPWVAALWGSLRQLSTGPIAIMSLLVLTTLTPLAEPGSVQFVQLAMLLSLMVGILYLGIGLFRLGLVMSFISHSAVRGFTSAAALIIIATQLPGFLGIEVSRHEYILPMLLEVARGLGRIHFPTLVVGILALGIIYAIRRYSRNLPGGLIALVTTTVALVLFEWHEAGIAVLGPIPEGLPCFQTPMTDLRAAGSLIGPAFVIALVSFAETYSVGKAISAETKQKVDVDREFLGQGLANVVGALFQSFPVSGSFSRTAINYAAGARTAISSVIASVIVVLALLFLTPLLTYIPKTALSALVMSAVLLLFHPREVLKLWKMNRHDGVVAVSVFVLALLTKPDYALLIGVIVSLVFFLWKTMHPRIVRITKDPELNMFLNADEFRKPNCPQILELRSDNCIFFGNAEYTLEHILERLDEQDGPLAYLLLDFEAIGFIDISATDELQGLLEELENRKINLAFLNVHLPVKTVFRSTGFMEKIRSELIFARREDAVAVMFRNLDHAYCAGVCPYRLFQECSTVK
ncbi:MAG: SulP family inorganic anion transporter [Deltaproteobacteria bacterium]|nr:SulP family inorganic anion transporter [Deltaproteobacteria bacterium]